MRILPVNAANYYASRRNNPVKNQPEQTQANVSFNGITSVLQKQIYPDGQRAIMELIMNKPGKSKVVGQLPKFMIDKIPATERRIATQEITEAFGQVAEKIRNFRGEFHRPKTEEEIFARFKKNSRGEYIQDKTGEKRPVEANEILTNVLRKFNILKENESVDLRFVGEDKNSGVKAFFVKGLHDTRMSDDEYLLKVYPEIIKKEWHEAKRSGVHAELNAAAYWMKHEGMDTQKGKFYLGDLESGFMLTKYINEDVRRPQNIVDPYKYGIVYDLRTKQNRELHEQHLIKGYDVSWSRLAVVNKVKNKSKAARIYMDKIKHGGETVMNRELKGTPDEQLMRLGLTRSKRGLVVSDKAAFEKAGFVMRKDGSIIKDLGPEKRYELWLQEMSDANKTEGKLAGLAMAIKHLPPRVQNECIERCMSYNSPLVNQGLAYVLKYLPTEDAMKYFEKLAKTGDKETQVILLNEIPLLSKKVAHTEAKITDDINVSLRDIDPEKITEYYRLAEKCTIPIVWEHLASFLHMLPSTEAQHFYSVLTNKTLPKEVQAHIKDRMIYKARNLDDESEGAFATRNMLAKDGVKISKK